MGLGRVGGCVRVLAKSENGLRSFHSLSSLTFNSNASTKFGYTSHLFRDFLSIPLAALHLVLLPMDLP